VTGWLPARPVADVRPSPTLFFNFFSFYFFSLPFPGPRQLTRKFLFRIFISNFCSEFLFRICFSNVYSEFFFEFFSNLFSSFCSEFLFRIFVPNFYFEFVFRIFVPNFCSEFLFRICVPNFYLEFVFRIFVSNFYFFLFFYCWGIFTPPNCVTCISNADQKKTGNF
jgi:hypothetical protein